MQSALILDTCVLPQKGGVHSNPLLSALIRIAVIKQFEVLIVDISRSESLSKRKRNADEAIERLQTAIRLAEKYFEREHLDFYLPSSNDAVELWKEDLDASFTIINTHGEDAVEALHREAWRRPPAKATASESATGSRDSAIWLSVKRKHSQTTDSITYFVSSNSNDFSDNQDKTKLRQELLEELKDSASQFHYFISISSVVDHLAEKAELAEIDHSQLQDMLAKTHMDVGILEALEAQSNRLDDIVPATLWVTSATELRAYVVDGARLAQVSVDFSVFVEAVEAGAPSPDEPISCTGVVWVSHIEGELTFEIEYLQFRDTTLKPR